MVDEMNKFEGAADSVAAGAVETAPEAAAQELGGQGAAVPSKKRKKWPIVLGVIIVVVALAGVGFTVWHAQPSFCNAICHSPMDPYVENYFEGNGMARIHAEAGVVCLDCHEPDMGQQIEEATKWVTGNFKAKLDLINYDGHLCLDCHDEEAVKQNTADLDKNPHTQAHQIMECTDCHRSHTKQVDYCANCHSNGGQTMITFPLQKEYALDTTPNW